ncbi:hypothetical protein LCL97_19090 [Seohaeicola saemankumensis]|nr:PA14 domain-containing protein [Seohaeicola saemankumensis]MCA0872942.1 hypothetical protein [Seohaeicola saemankumensis]
MRTAITGLLAAASLLLASAAIAAPLKLKPASPQPSPKRGLAVSYAWGGVPPARIQGLSAARGLLGGGGKAGRPLRGLDYADTNEGDPVLTHPEHFNVAANIRGYIKFDAPGIYELETWSNDGISATVSGQTIGHFDGRQGCEANQRVEVEVPQAGWYDLRILYFQKYGSACLMMKWGKKGKKMSWVPNSAFGY